VPDRDVTHSDLVEIAKRNGDFRKSYGILVGAILYLRSISAARPRLFWRQTLLAAVAGALGFWCARGSGRIIASKKDVQTSL
jgi:hypothetical protein